MLRYVSPPPTRSRGVINRTRSDAASRLSLGTRIGLGTASNDHQGLRLTGSLSLARSRIAGFGFHVFLFLKSGLGFAALRRLPFHFFTAFDWTAWIFAVCGLTILPIAQTKPASSRPNAAAATWDFFRPTPV